MTAVEWLAEKYYDSEGKLTRQDFEQAKEMEKQKLIEMHDKGFDSVKQLNDEYAIEFAEWIEECQGGTPNSKILKELLEIFKKEKGL
jgi:hypothetical protein